MTDESERIGDWLRQLERGDANALAHVFDHFRPQLQRMVSLRMVPAVRPRLDESDVLQEAFLEAHRQLPRYLDNRAVPVHVWLRQVTQDRLKKAHRKHLGTQKCAVGREICLPGESSLQLAAPFVNRSTSPSQRALRKELSGRVERVFAQLAEQDREVILLRFFEKIPNKEVAEILGIAEPTATMRFGRAMARFHENLKAEFAGESHP